jgi:serine phosphatase RsbU (regulator of sigma subunit)
MKYFGDKIALGEKSDTIYTTKTIYLNTGDKILMYSDGFVDQFGGDGGKKFGTRQLMALLEDNRNNNFEGLTSAILDTYFEWKGEVDQIDDVTFLSLEF